MTTEAPSNDTFDALRGRLSGSLATPGDAGYDEARAVWNAMIDRRPAAVVQAANVDDVVAAVGLARDHRLELAVRGGGHNVAGNGTVDDGLVLDLGAMRAVSVDPATNQVTVQGGATLADVDAATEPHGLAVPIGVISGTGIGGLTLGGGVGWLTRPYGLAADNLVSVELVAADGQVISASAEDHADLFWALHGGGGNFGVVTSFTFQAHPHGPQVLAGNLIYHPDNWARTWRALEVWTRDLPDAMTTITTTLTPPPVLELGDDPVLLVAFAWASPDRAQGQALADSLRAASAPDVEDVGDFRWVEWQSAVDVLFPKGVRAYWRNTSFDRLDDEVIDVLVRRGLEQRWLGTAFDVHHMGGAFGRVPEDATPFPHRDARYWINIYGFWADAVDDDERVAFVRGTSADMAPFSTGGEYVNFQGREQTGHRALDPREVFGPAKLERLMTVKRRYDPANLFHMNHNIAPG
jgi:FAD/FMN-containing dehydrogenase